VWLVAVFVAGPLMAIMAVNFAVIVSSRVNDPRVAEQMAAVIIVPLLGMLFGQLAGVIVLNVQFMLVAVSIILIVDVGLIYLGARLFQRETILTKWK
jgi:ABC-2 type transport system permease protein